MSLFDPQPNFIEHDTFLFALLGLMSIDKKFQALLNLSPIEDAANSDKSVPAHDLENDEFILAALGLTSIDTKLNSVLLEWTENELVSAQTSTPEAYGFENIDGLLR